MSTDNKSNKAKHHEMEKTVEHVLPFINQTKATLTFLNTWSQPLDSSRFHPERGNRGKVDLVSLVIMKLTTYITVATMRKPKTVMVL